MSDDMILVSAARFKELEALEASIPAMLEKSHGNGWKDRLKILDAKRKADPEAYSKHKLEQYHKNKDAINARRRELRKLKKAAAADGPFTTPG